LPTFVIAISDRKLCKGKNAIAERLTLGLFFAAISLNPLLEALNSDWNAMAAVGAHDKLKKLDAGIRIRSLSLEYELSADIDVASFNHSMLVQPDVYLRLRPGKEEVVQSALQAAGISYRQVSDGV
jgi:16S rRNA (cytosine967-C5)-methyltransferase